MKVGTTLITQSLSDDRLKVREYIGEQDGFYVVSERYVSADQPVKPLGNTYYDLQGREVKSEWHDGLAYFSPYSCMYAVGQCEETLDYPNPLAKNAEKRTVSTKAYVNRLEGSTFIITWKLSGGNTIEVPFELGPYNFCVSSEYQNALG